MIQGIPSRFGATSFNRFAPYIGQLLKQWPRALVVDPSPLTPDSWASAFRAALRGKREHNHCNSYVDEMLWLKYNQQIVCSMRSDGQIVLGDSITVKEPTGVKFGTGIPDKLVEITQVYFLDQICNLLSQKVFEPSPTFCVKGTKQDQRDMLENRYDVAFEKQDNDTYIIL